MASTKLNGGIPSSQPRATPSATPQRDSWRRQFLRRGRTVLPCIANVVLVLTNDPRWKGVFAYDVFLGDIVTLHSVRWPEEIAPSEQKPGDWKEEDTLRLGVWLARTYNLVCNQGVIGEGLRVVAARKTIHPVRDWLTKLEWDGVGRADDFLIRLAGAEDSVYVRAVSKNFLIGAVARVMQPGAKVDSMPIFEGPQGIGKSTLLQILGGEWFLDTSIEIGTKDSYQILRRKWIVEFGEIDSLSRSEMSRTKQYLATRTDTYRPSYGRVSIDYPRQCVFAGTTNANEYLKDDTGARRMWPVKIGVVDTEALKRERDQLWAEALSRYQGGEHWHFEDESLRKEAALQAETRRQTHPWEQPVARWLAGLKPRRAYLGVTTYEVLTEGLEMGPERVGRGEEMTAATILRICGWTDVRRDATTPGVPRRYRRPGVLRPVDGETTSILVGSDGKRLDHRVSEKQG